MTAPTPDDPDAAAPDALRHRAALAVFAAAAAVFAPSLAGGFVWDDHDLIETNTWVREPGHLRDLLTRDFWAFSNAVHAGEARYYRPLVSLLYAAEHRLLGGSPAAFHAVSVLLHAACAALSFVWLLGRLGGSRRALVPSLLGAMLFALHPVRVESVAWVSGTTDLLMALFALLALLAAQSGGLSRVGAFAFLAAACKESAVTVPAVLAADALLTTARATPARRDALRAAGAALAGVAALFAVRTALVGWAPVTTLHEGPAAAAARVLASLGGYARLALLPAPLSSMGAYSRYASPGVVDYAAPMVALGALSFGAAAALALASRRRPALRPWLADAALFLIALSPTLNLVPLRLSVLVAPRFLYLPLLGLCALAARALAASPQLGPRLAAGVAVAACALASASHAEHYLTDRALWEHETRLNPGSSFAWKALVGVELGEGRFDRAIQASAQQFASAQRAHDPDYTVEALLESARVLLQALPDASQLDLEGVLAFQRRLAEGNTELRLETSSVRGTVRLHRVTPAQRAWLRRHADLPWALLRTQRFEEARAVALATLREGPASADLWHHLSDALANLERWPEALAAAREAARRRPQHAPYARRVALLAAVGERLARLPDDPVTAAVLRADAFRLLGAYEHARRALAPVITASPQRPEPMTVRIHADIEDRQYAAARRSLDDARRRFPALGADWAQLGAMLDAREELPR